MTTGQRAVAIQLASALRDAMPRGDFDEERFLSRLFAEGPEDSRGTARETS